MVHKGINKVILIGNLGHNPEIRHIPNGTTIANIILATSESWRDKQTGEKKEKTEWHKVVLFGKLAEIAAEYLHKGSQVYIEGYLQTRRWQDNNSQDHYVTEVIVSVGGTMQMLGGRQTNNSNVALQNTTSLNTWDDKKQSDHVQTYNKNSSTRKINDNVQGTNDESSINFDDDIPF